MSCQSARFSAELLYNSGWTMEKEIMADVAGNKNIIHKSKLFRKHKQFGDNINQLANI